MPSTPSPPTAPLILRHHDVLKLLHTIEPPALLSLLSVLLKTLHQYSTSSSSSSSSDNAGNAETGGPGKLYQPPRVSITTSINQTTLFKPCATDSATCIKTVSLGPLGHARGTITMMKPDGSLDGLLNAAAITAFRTALVSTILLVARRRLGVTMRNVVIFGTGNIAKWTLRLVASLVPEHELEGVTVVGRGRDEKVSEKIGMDVGVDEAMVRVLGRDEPGFEGRLEEALGGAEAVFCCTPATEPLFPARFLEKRKRVYVSAIGSYKPGMRELDPELLRLPGWKVVVDSKDECLKGAGEVIDAGLREEELCELGEIELREPGRVSPAFEELELEERWRGNVVFKCVGLACMDLAVAGELLRIARKKGVGITVEGFEE